jgi:rhomboid family GlyGly-CTERM serine protease
VADARSPDLAREQVRDRRLGNFHRGHAWLIGALATPMVLLAFSGNATRLVLRYERDAVSNGDVWRLLTGHLVHGDFRHLLLNLAGMALVAQLFGRDYSPRQWLLVMLASCAAIDIGFVFYEPQLAWYVGFSGVLHGAIAAGVVAWWRYENRALTVTVGLLLMLKLLWEQLRGALPFSGDMPVIVNAHLYGAIGGLAGAALICWMQRYWPRRA